MTLAAAPAPGAGYTLSGVGTARSLDLVYEAFAAVDRPADINRAVPSAGGIYPYECQLVTWEDDGLALFRLDLERRVCWRARPRKPLSRQLRSAGLVVPPPAGALLFLVTRPWLSIRKYGIRGHLYAQLDASHLALNILGIATDRDCPAELLLCFDREQMAAALAGPIDYREVHSVLRLGTDSNTSLDPGWRLQDEREAAVNESDDRLERAAWDLWRPLTQDSSLRGLGSRRRSLVPLSRRLLRDRPFPSGTGWGALSRSRESAKNFSSDVLPQSLLWQTLSACTADLNTDLRGETPLQLTLVARRVQDMSPTSLRLTEVTHGSSSRCCASVADGEVVRACMYQEHLRMAAAFVLFHSPRAGLFDRQGGFLRETLFRTGALAQLLYLGATEARIGVTAVGGFDAQRWLHNAHLPDDHELLYIVSLGLRSDSGAKVDRLTTAHYPRVVGQNEKPSRE
jgi:hypothetical protein